jgi:glycosyltransferase involved in cell wall biosynthesis
MEITVIIPSYNCKRYIEETLSSLFAQSYKSWRAIVFDDGSSDGSFELLQNIAAQNPKIKLLHRAGGANKGLAQTLQEALAEVKTKYAAFLEQDDLWRPDYLEQKAALLKENPGVKIIFNGVEPFGTPSRVRKLNIYYKAVNFYLKILNPFKKNYNLSFALFTFNPVPTFSCVLAETALFKDLDFCTPFGPWLDRWLWLQLAFKNKFYFTPAKLTRWRLHAKSHTVKTLGDIGRHALPFNESAQKFYLRRYGLFKFYAVKYISLVLELLFAVLSLPLKLLLGRG